MKRTILLPIILLALAAPAAAKDQKVKITSTPPGAMVFIDGVYAGTAPLSKALAPGTYRLKLVRKGFSDWTAAVKVPLEKPAIDVALQPLKKGTIHVTSEPSKGTVFLDGREMGDTPLLIEDLPDDVYELRVQKQGYENSQQSVEIIDGKDVEAAVTLKSRMEEYCLGKLQKNPDDLATHTELGHYYLLEGKWGSARDIMKKGVLVAARSTGRNNDVMRFYQELTKQFTGQFQFTDDLAAFRESFGDVIEYAIEFGPGKSQHTQRLVSLYASMGRVEAMVKLADRMHASEPTRGVYKELSRVYLESGMTQAAIRMLARALEVKDEFDTRVSLGSAYQRLYKYDEALEQYQQAEKLEATPRQKADLMIFLARLYARKGMHNKAIECLDAAIEHQPSGVNTSAWTSLRINTLVEAGRCDDARKVADEQLKRAVSTRDRREAQSNLLLINTHCKDKEPEVK